MPFCIFYLFVVQIEFEFLEFKFNLNLFESSFKKNEKPFSLSLTPLTPAQPNLFFFFLLTPAAQNPAQALPSLPSPPTQDHLLYRAGGRRPGDARPTCRP